MPIPLQWFSIELPFFTRRKGYKLNVLCRTNMRLWLRFHVCHVPLLSLFVIAASCALLRQSDKKCYSFPNRFASSGTALVSLEDDAFYCLLTAILAIETHAVYDYNSVRPPTRMLPSMRSCQFGLRRPKFNIYLVAYESGVCIFLLAVQVSLRLSGRLVYIFGRLSCAHQQSQYDSCIRRLCNIFA